MFSSGGSGFTGAVFVFRLAIDKKTKQVMQMGIIKNFVESVFDDYRNNKITLKQLIICLCRYADKNIAYEWLWSIFENELNNHFNENGEITY